MANSTDPTEPLPFMPPAMATLEAQLEKRARRKTKVLSWVAGLALLITLLVYDAIQGMSIFSLLTTMVGIPYSLFRLLEWKSDQADFAHLLKALTEWEDPRAVGLLCLAYRHRGNREKDTYRSRLLQSLPLLTEKDAEYFTLSQHDALHSLLRGDDRDLKIAALTGLAQVGNKSTLPFLQTLLKQHETHPHESLKAAIETCRDAVASRLERDSLSSMLLRPSHETNAGADILLRPSRETDTDETQLLRPKE